MVDEFAVKFGAEYLDKQFAGSKRADLVGMLNHVDYFERVIMVIEEVNETLRQRPAVYVQRIDGRIVFNQLSGDREITDDDLKLNIQMYHEWCNAQAEALEQGNAYSPPEDFGKSN